MLRSLVTAREGMDARLLYWNLELPFQFDLDNVRRSLERGAVERLDDGSLQSVDPWGIAVRLFAK
jgi:hypothetical protein